MVVMHPPASEVELILDVTESRSVRKYKVKFNVCELLLRNIEHNQVLSPLLKLEPLIHLVVS